MEIFYYIIKSETNYYIKLLLKKILNWALVLFCLLFHDIYKIKSIEKMNAIKFMIFYGGNVFKIFEMFII